MASPSTCSVTRLVASGPGAGKEASPDAARRRRTDGPDRLDEGYIEAALKLAAGVRTLTPPLVLRPHRRPGHGRHGSTRTSPPRAWAVSTAARLGQSPAFQPGSTPAFRQLWLPAGPGTRSRSCCASCKLCRRRRPGRAGVRRLWSRPTQSSTTPRARRGAAPAHSSTTHAAQGLRPLRNNPNPLRRPGRTTG